MITSTLCFYPCADIDRTAHFYTEIIGLNVAMKEENQCVLNANSGNIGFVNYGDGIMASGHICISFNCKDRNAVDAQYQRIKKMGYPVRTTPAKHPKFPVYSFFLEDPNGYTVEFQKIDDVDL